MPTIRPTLRALVLTVLVAAASSVSAQAPADVKGLWRGGSAPTRPADAPRRAAPTPARPVVSPAKGDSAAGSEALVSRTVAESLAVKAAEAVAAEFTLALAQLQAELDSLRTAATASAQASAAAKQSADRALAGIGNFRFSGDLRVRYEGQFHGGGVVPRHRERSRARFGFSGNLSDRLSGAIALASGDLTDHQSSNQTQTNVFSRKTLGLDRFFLQWKPSGASGFGVVAGKFPYPWERTSLTFGNDINPEGVAPSYTWARSGLLERIAVVGFVLPYWEVSGGDDSFIAGAQLQTRWKFNPRLSARLSGALVDFTGADAIAQAVKAGSVKPSAPATNALRTDSTGKVLGYASAFQLADAQLQVSYVQNAKWPVTASVNAVRNLRAASGSALGARAELVVGRLSRPRDLLVSWAMYRIEREAVIGALNEQDLRAATNVLNHRIGVSYQFVPNAALNLGLWRGRLLDPTQNASLVPAPLRTGCGGAPGVCTDPWFNRLQLDVAYKF